jgi:zinc protease
MSGISYAEIDRMIEKLKQVTPEQVQAVAQKYFNDDAMTVATLVPLPITSPKSAPPAGTLR